MEKFGYSIEPGHYAYPFTIDVPDWLPASIHQACEQYLYQYNIKYLLRAQY